MDNKIKLIFYNYYQFNYLTMLFLILFFLLKYSINN